MNEEEQWHRHVVRMMNDVSFTVEFQLRTDQARITDIVGWVDDEIAIGEGTYKEIRAEADRVIDLAVRWGRCSKYANRGAGGELKRNLYAASRVAKMGPLHPLTCYFTNG